MQETRIKLVDFDMTGTIIDGPIDLSRRWRNDDGKGCKAPVVAFETTLRAYRISLPWSVIRQPMGLSRETHLRQLVELPEAIEQYTHNHGAKYTTEIFESMCQRLHKEMRIAMLDADLILPIRGLDRVIDELRRMNLKIGTDSDYDQADAEAVLEVLETMRGIRFDASAHAEATQDRPYPLKLKSLMVQTEILSPDQIVKVDDTASGLIAAKRTGVWTVGVYESGSDDKNKLELAKPDFLIPDITQLPALIRNEINPRIATRLQRQRKLPSVPALRPVPIVPAT